MRTFRRLPSLAALSALPTLSALSALPARLALLAVLAVLASGSLSGCAALAGSPAASASRPVDTLFYISARAREAGKSVPRLATALEYGLVITYRSTLADPNEGRVAFDVVDSVLLTRDAFIAQLRARVVTPADPDAFAVLYTHGFATGLGEAWEHSASSRTRARSTRPWIVFAWPSIGSGVAWPREGVIFSAAYRADSASAVASRGAYAAALGTVRDAIGGSRILAVAHSLGGQLIGETLASDTALQVALRADPLRAIAFVSPDIQAARFGDTIAPRIRPLSQRVVLYASSDDRMLAMSEVVNDSERAGYIGDSKCGPIVRDVLETVDMTDGAYADSDLIHTFGTRHALRRKSAVLFDLVHVVGDQHLATCRATLGTAAMLPSGAWKLLKGAVPSPDAALQCAAASSMH